MNKQLNEMSLLMTGSGSSIYMVESFMEEHYAFRRNLLSGKTEMAVLKDIDEGSPDEEASSDVAVSSDDEASSVDEKEETTLQNSNLKWEVMTKEKVNSIVRAAKKWEWEARSRPDRTSRNTSALMSFLTLILSELISWDCPSGTARTMLPNCSAEYRG